MWRFANLHEILRDCAEKAGKAPGGAAAHQRGLSTLHEAMREIAVAAKPSIT